MATRRRWLSWVKVALALGLLGYVFLSGKIDLHEVWNALDRWPYLLAGVLGVVVVFAFGILRWWLLLLSQGIEITFRETFRVSFIGYFFNTVMPGAVGGDLVKAFYVAKDRPGKRVEAVSTIALDRLIGLYAMLTISGVAALAVPSIGFHHHERFAYLSKIVLGLVGSGAVAIAVLLLVDLRRWSFLTDPDGQAGPVRGAIVRLYASLWLYRSQKRVLLLAYLCSLGAHAFNIIIHIFLARALGGAAIELPMFIYLIPIALVGNGLPIAPGGWGVGEAWYDFLFRIATGLPNNIGSELALLMHLSFNFWNLLGFLAYIGHRSEADEARRLAEAEAAGEGSAGTAAPPGEQAPPPGGSADTGAPSPPDGL